MIFTGRTRYLYDTSAHTSTAEDWVKIAARRMSEVANSVTDADIAEHLRRRSASLRDFARSLHEDVSSLDDLYERALAEARQERAEPDEDFSEIARI